MAYQNAFYRNARQPPGFGETGFLIFTQFLVFWDRGRHTLIFNVNSLVVQILLGQSVKKEELRPRVAKPFA
jgi:hypothetical protein